MSLIDNLDQQTHLDGDAQLHQRYVTAMFEEIAPRYDSFTRWFSYGMDAGWKRELVAAVLRHAPADARSVRDLACGTGDLACAMAEAIPAAAVEGVDVAAGMIARARTHARISYRVGDATRLADADGSVDVVSIGYGLRNFPDHRAALAEVGLSEHADRHFAGRRGRHPGIHPAALAGLALAAAGLPVDGGDAVRLAMAPAWSGLRLHRTFDRPLRHPPPTGRRLRRRRPDHGPRGPRPGRRDVHPGCAQGIDAGSSLRPTVSQQQ